MWNAVVALAASAAAAGGLQRSPAGDGGERHAQDGEQEDDGAYRKDFHGWVGPFLKAYPKILARAGGPCYTGVLG